MGCAVNLSQPLHIKQGQIVSICDRFLLNSQKSFFCKKIVTLFMDLLGVSERENGDSVLHTWKFRAEWDL